MTPGERHISLDIALLIAAIVVIVVAMFAGSTLIA